MGVGLGKSLKSVRWGTSCCLAGYLLLLGTAAYGASIDLDTMLTAVKNNADSVLRLVGSTATVLGIWFIFSAVNELKKVGQSATMQAQSGTTGPLIKMVVGALLFYLPNTVSIGIATFWGDSNSSIVAYEASSSDFFAPIKDGSIAVVRVVGYISLVKGLVMLSKSSEHGQQGGFGKGIAHVIGGILAINIVGTIKVLGGTLGIDVFS